MVHSLGHVILTLKSVNYLLPSDFLAAFVTLLNRQKCLVSSFGCNIHGYRGRLVNRYKLVLYMYVCVCVFVARPCCMTQSPTEVMEHMLPYIGIYCCVQTVLLFIVVRKTFVSYHEEIYNFEGVGVCFPTVYVQLILSPHYRLRRFIMTIFLGSK